jgi:hypothetical protein
VFDGQNITEKVFMKTSILLLQYDRVKQAFQSFITVSYKADKALRHFPALPPKKIKLS